MHGTRTICGQIQQLRSSIQSCLPVIGLLPQNIPIDPLPLPDGVVGILNLQWRERILVSIPEGGIQSAELVDQDAHRPAVRDNVMPGDQQGMLIFLHANQPAPNEWTSLQHEGLSSLQVGKPMELLLRLR